MNEIELQWRIMFDCPVCEKQSGYRATKMDFDPAFWLIEDAAYVEVQCPDCAMIYRVKIAGF